MKKEGNKLAENEGSNLKVFILMGILMIIIAAGTSFMFMTYMSTSAENTDNEVNEKKVGPTYPLGEFVVNLSLDSSYKYLKADIVVSANSDKVKDELESRNPQIRDSIISILRKQSLEDIREPSAEVIKNQIKGKLNQLLNSGQIDNVWFTQLVVQ
jgi:flagellar basal body-associated protein FliL